MYLLSLPQRVTDFTKYPHLPNNSENTMKRDVLFNSGNDLHRINALLRIESMKPLLLNKTLSNVLNNPLCQSHLDLSYFAGLEEGLSQ